VLVLLPASAWAVRLKDVATFGGVRSNQLVGYGQVVGLSGTGDKTGSQFTVQSVASHAGEDGRAVDKSKLKPKNVPR
jgi:flagellar P-ring protein precursor FlgI